MSAGRNAPRRPRQPLSAACAAPKKRPIDANGSTKHAYSNPSAAMPSRFAGMSYNTSTACSRSRPGMDTMPRKIIHPM